MPSDERELRLPCVVICRPRDMAARARLQSRGRLTPILMFLRYRPSGAHRFSGPRPHILKIAPINIVCRQHLSNSLTQKVFAAVPLPRLSSINTARGRIVSKDNKTTSSILQIAFHNGDYATFDVILREAQATTSRERGSHVGWTLSTDCSGAFCRCCNL